MAKCKICKDEQLVTLVDFGPQPLCNRFVVDPGKEEYRHPMVLGQCGSCGLLQLIDPVPADEIVPRFAWLRYNEPEGHLDDLADVLSSLEGLPANPVACGLTYKDDSLLNRLKSRAYTNVWRIDPQSDLDVSTEGAAGETIIPRLTQEKVEQLADRRGRVNLIVARHVLEHTRDAPSFLEAIRPLLEPGGYVAFEVPDCTSQLESCNYSMMWEEHVLYFVPRTLKSSFARTSFNFSHYRNYPLPIENALVAVVTESDCSEAAVDREDPIPLLLAMGKAFTENIAEARDRLKRRLTQCRESVGKIAVFGAGHLSCTFINLMEISDYIDLVVDDDTHKQTLYMPGSRLPIMGAESLIEEDIGLCLLIMSSESESKVIAKNKGFVEKGGTFASVFPNRENSLQLGDKVV